jgi:hypothetical protein
MDPFVTVLARNRMGIRARQHLPACSFSQGYRSDTSDGSKYPSGVYYYRIHAGECATIRKMLPVK